jgi:3-oxoadipate enol-lactonase
MPTVCIGSQAIFYDEHGSGRPLVLISGLGGTRLGWRKQIEPLAQQFRLIAFDNRDAGCSGPSDVPYNIANMATDAAGLIQKLALGPSYVAGWSMGGFIAQELAIRYPELVKRLVLVATMAGGPSTVYAEPEVLATLAYDESLDVEEGVRRSYALTTGPGFAQAHPEDVEQAIANARVMRMPPQNYQRQLGAVMRHDTSDRLARIAAPTLIIHGDADALVPYANGKYLAAQIPSARLSTFESVGHLPPIEAPARFNREIIEFFSA